MESIALCSNVGESTASGVIQALPAVSQDPEILLDSRVLVGWAWKSVTETTGRKGNPDLGLDVVCATYRGDIRTRCWEDRSRNARLKSLVWNNRLGKYLQESCRVLAIIRLASRTGSGITRREQD
jgi:hypothetical protein